MDSHRSSEQGQHEGRDAALELAWGSGICDRCGATIVLGDQVKRVEHGHTVVMCSSCAAQPFDVGVWREREQDARRAAFDALAAAFEDEELEEAA